MEWGPDWMGDFAGGGSMKQHRRLAGSVLSEALSLEAGTRDEVYLAHLDESGICGKRSESLLLCCRSDLCNSILCWG